MYNFYLTMALNKTAVHAQLKIITQSSSKQGRSLKKTIFVWTKRKT